MATEIRVPTLGESVSEATIGRWFKKAGDTVKADEPIVELETDKVTLEVNAPAAGVLSEIAVKDGETVSPGALLGQIESAASGGKGKTAKTSGPAAAAKAGKDPVAATSAAVGEPAARDEAGAGYGNHAAVPAAVAQVVPASAASSGGGGTDIKVPTLGESVSEGTVGTWTKKVGDTVARDEVLVEIETDKVAVEIASPADGVLSEITAEAGSSVVPNQVIARIGGASNAGVQQPSGAGDDTPANEPPAAQKGPQPASLSPSVQRIVAENRLDVGTIHGTGPDGRITKGDALEASQGSALAPAKLSASPSKAPATSSQTAPAVPAAAARPPGEREERVRMTRLRQTIARRLKDAQNAAAMLTTFNEVDMTNVMALRNQYKDSFEKKHGVKLGFMSFFTRACIAALKEVPDVNAEIDGSDVIYKNHYDIGVAVGTDKGLVVPVVRDADALSLAGIEKAIGALGKKARDGKLAIEDMQGGTFTITNGGVYGSLMSTPILNAPQSGVLGMHNIVQRPMAVDGQVLIRPMMYLALSYDHRIVDGKGAVTFLVSVKNAIEDPQRMLLDV